MMMDSKTMNFPLSKELNSKMHLCNSFCFCTGLCRSRKTVVVFLLLFIMCVVCSRFLCFFFCIVFVRLKKSISTDLCRWASSSKPQRRSTLAVARGKQGRQLLLGVRTAVASVSRILSRRFLVCGR